MIPKIHAGKDIDKLPSWQGECAAIVASGASAKGVDYSLLKERIHILAINQSWELCPFADILYSCDINWWRLARGATGFKGIKVTQDKIASSEYPELIRVDVDPNSNDILMDKLGFVGAGGNSGFQALNLLVQMGVTAIMLIGCDMVGEHWHGRHGPPCTNPDESNFRRWRGAFNGVKPKLIDLGVDVVNCSDISTITAYPKMGVKDALARWGL